jgi:phosphoglycerate kinase
VFVNDAFGTAHRKHASNVGIASNIEESCIGFLIQEELTNLSRITNNPKKPVIAILGGAKVSDKLKVINNLLTIADKILICGGMAYTFKKAQGMDIGTSLLEEEMLPEAKRLLEQAGNKIILSQDFYCAVEFADVQPIYRKASEGLNGVMGLDIGPDTVVSFAQSLKGAGAVF